MSTCIIKIDKINTIGEVAFFEVVFEKGKGFGREWRGTTNAEIYVAKGTVVTPSA